ncbi:hypothetical protein Syun_025520 [Stephania yunnanensis]|uniref:Uncharacterized protein n=1 Tax=Stephania yunnanensis TaxID=152371 RepID=A0AAP0HW96_9MAGN
MNLHSLDQNTIVFFVVFDQNLNRTTPSPPSQHHCISASFAHLITSRVFLLLHLFD